MSAGRPYHSYVRAKFPEHGLRTAASLRRNAPPHPRRFLLLNAVRILNGRNIALIRQVVTRPDRRDNLIECLPVFRFLILSLMALRLSLEGMVSEYVADPS